MNAAMDVGSARQEMLELREMEIVAAGGMPEILLAEDNPSDVYLIRTALMEHGIELPLQVATDGQEVLQILDRHEALAKTRINLIILDLSLPRHDGIEILQRIRGSALLRRIPVVILTSSDSPSDRMAASQLGATRFLRKPSSLEQFLSLGAAFQELLGQAKAQSGGV